MMQEKFQEQLEIGHLAKDLASKAFINSGYKVWDVGSHSLPAKYPYRDKYLHVDKYVTGEHRFWLEVKARKLRKHHSTGMPMNVCWIDSYDMEWLIDWHTKTKIPPFIVFALYKENVMDSTLYIISVYGARNNNVDIKGRLYIRNKKLMLLDNWFIKVKEYPDKWHAII